MSDLGNYFVVALPGQPLRDSHNKWPFSHQVALKLLKEFGIYDATKDVYWTKVPAYIDGEDRERRWQPIGGVELFKRCLAMSHCKAGVILAQMKGDDTPPPMLHDQALPMLLVTFRDEQFHVV